MQRICCYSIDYWRGLEAAGVDNYGKGHSDWYHWNKNSNRMAQDIARDYNLGKVLTFIVPLSKPFLRHPYIGTSSLLFLAERRT